jgi:hypothetical protein
MSEESIGRAVGQLAITQRAILLFGSIGRQETPPDGEAQDHRQQS